MHAFLLGCYPDVHFAVLTYFSMTACQAYSCTYSCLDATPTYTSLC